MPDAATLRMARKRKKAVSERDLEGFKLLEPVSELLAALRDEGNPNRKIRPRPNGLRTRPHVLLDRHWEGAGLESCLLVPVPVPVPVPETCPPPDL